MTAAGPAIYELRGATMGHGRKPVLHGVDFALRTGSTVGILGANGAGKSTFLATLAGVIPPLGSEVFRRYGEPMRAGAKSSRVAYVPQGARVFPSLSVTECLSLAARVTRRPVEDNLERVLDMFPRLRERADQRGSSLSGGERQMLAVGMALMQEPEVILLDEPSIGLAPNLVAHIITTLRGLAHDGLTVLVAEQNVRSILPLVTDLFVIRQGAIEGPIESTSIITEQQMIQLLL